ncbi:MAG: ATP-dependent helicase [Ancrocorticia sp.]|jgi:Superfamily I DNA and RNA helicases|nr:ATP-dependent helicase [Ancrocorticia sp.]MCI2194190.1 ATP-dependent helicase [Ancrocorticia sp.]MCI2199049.1 ATP-dependent helicase [Ancrocorticia sp.]
MGLGETQWDHSQSAALDACRPGCRVSIVGAAGSGKTSVVQALVEREIERDSAQSIAVLTTDRRAAGLLRNQLAQSVGGLGETVRVMSLAAFCFSVIQTYAQAVGRENPELIPGPDEDALLAEIIVDAASEIPFPQFVTADVRAMPSFRAQVRDLITRARELDLRPEELDDLGTQRNEPMWCAGARVMRIYDRATEDRDAFAGTASAPDRLDHAQLVSAAANIVDGWEEHVAAAPGNGAPVARPRWDWVIVDDVQNAPRSLLALLRVIAHANASIVVTGNPDAAVQGFRGGVASLPGDICRAEPDGLGAIGVRLDTCHRGGPRLHTTSERLASYIRIAGGSIGQRGSAPGGGADEVHGQRYVHREEEIAGIAHRIRYLHLVHHVPYAQIAIITRSHSSHLAIRRSLVRRGVPVEAIASDRPLREQPIIASLLAVIITALEITPGAHAAPEVAERYTVDSLDSILTSSLIGIDPLELSRMKRTLRGFELASGGQRSADELVECAIRDQEVAAELAPRGVEPLLRVGHIFGRIREAARTTDRQAEQVLWAAWNAAGRAEEWRRIALRGGVEGDAMDANLDAVIQLQRIAQRMADRNPFVTIDEFVEEVLSQDLPEDSIARLGAEKDAVTLTTPAASLGQSWPHVIIAGLQDGVWPNVTLRDALTHTTRLTQIVTGREVPGATPQMVRREAYEDVLDDELRQLLHAVTRAEESLFLACVDNDDEKPSRFFAAMGFVAEDPAENSESVGETAEPKRWRPTLKAPHPTPHELEAVELVGILRRIALQASHSAPHVAAAGARARSLLADLSHAGIESADASRWFDNLAVPESAPDPTADVAVSPSAVENYLDCPLRGFLTSIGGERRDGANNAAIGTFLHSLAEELPNGPSDTIVSAFEQGWAARFGDPTATLADHHEYVRRHAQAENLGLYVTKLPRPVAVEQRVYVPFDEHTAVTAKIDRISADEHGNLHVFDFKTGKAIPKKNVPDHPQLQLYQWALTKRHEMGEGAPCSSAELIFLDKAWIDDQSKRFIQRPLTEQQYERAEERITQTAQLLRETQFAAHPEKQKCRMCPFVRICPAQPEGALFS